MSTLKVKKLFPDAKVPNKPKTQTDSGFDCYAHNIKKIFIHHDSDAEIELNETKGFNSRIEVDSSIGDAKTTITLHSQERALIGTGIAATVGDGYELQVRSRSGYALKNGLMVLNSPGTVDSEYRNEIGVIILNTSRKTQTIKLGDAIAQLVPMKVELPNVEVVDNLDDTIRGQDGFGSTNS